MNGVRNKSEFEELLNEIERKGNDLIIFIRDQVLRKHISRNHRWYIMPKYWREKREKFERNPYWFLTLTQIYIGLRLDQAR